MGKSEAPNLNSQKINSLTNYHYLMATCALQSFVIEKPTGNESQDNQSQVQRIQLDALI